MLPKLRPAGSKTGRFIWIIGLGCLLFVLLMGVVTSFASASVHEMGPKDGLVGPLLQGTATPTATLQSTVTPTTSVQSTATPEESSVAGSPTFSVTLANLGYDETILNSPHDQIQYTFRLPENWAIESDGVLDLDLSYFYDQPNAEEFPTLFGELTVKLDDQTLDILSISEAELDHSRWSVPLPASSLNDPDRTRHFIELTFDAGLLCGTPHRANLVVYPTSSISLAPSQRPLELDLSRYPRPFHQQAFEPDIVRFVLPSQPTTNDLSNAAGIAAKLGDLSSRTLVISATLDSDLSQLVESNPAALGEHLFVIGQPQRNQVLPLLNETADLPVSLHQRQLALVAAGPVNVSPGGTYSYTFTITNTADQDVNLSLVDPLPPYAEFVTCLPECDEDDAANTITWSDNQLAPDEVIDLALTLRVSEVITGSVLENVVTLLEADLGPINANTLASSVVAAPSGAEPQVSVSEEGEYFFVYDGKAVAEGDGIIQEVLSPWSEDRAVLIITGLSDEAVQMASQTMSSEVRFPGMAGQVALVREALSRSEIGDTEPASVEMTFEELGFSDRVVRGGGSVKEVDYFFRVPSGWQMTEDAAIDLYFGHSELIDYDNSGLTVLLNTQPVASSALSEETAAGGHTRVGLAGANLRRGELNRLTLEIDLSMPGMCVDDGQAWFRIKNSSTIFLAHREYPGLYLDLNLFPTPFHLNRGLTDLLIAVPNAPTLDEWGTGLRLAASLGNSAAGRTMLPLVAIDGELTPEELGNQNIIAIGRPTRSSLTQRVNASLPQPFLPGSDEIDQQLEDVVFRLPPGIDLGYLQLIPSPWDASRAFLAVTGTTEKSVGWASTVLADQPWILGSGNLALVKEGDVRTIDTRALTSKGLAQAMTTALPEMTEMATETATATASPASSSPSPTSGVSAAGQASGAQARPAWLIPLIVITGLMVLAIFAIAFWRARRKRL